MLTRFKLVNTTGLKALNFGGDTIPLDQIDDALAEKLIDKTHVLERVALTTAPAVAQLPQLASETPAAEVEAPSPGRKKIASN